MRKLGRKKQNRQMLLRNLVTSLIIFEKVKTTQAKAKEVKKLTEKIISIGKSKSLEARRKLIGFLLHKNAVNKIFEDLVSRYENINSGFVKSYHLAPRIGDGSKMMLLELMGAKKQEKKADSVKVDANKELNKEIAKPEPSLKSKDKITSKGKNAKK